MITLTIGNSLCRIEGLSVDQHKALREMLSYTVKGGHFSGHRGPNRRYLLDKKGCFPTGLLYIVEKWLEPMNCSATVIHLRQRPKAQEGLFDLSLPYPLYPEQEAAVEAAIAANRGVIVAPTGLGKSAIIAFMIYRLQVPTLVVVPSLELKRQLSASLKSAFGREFVGGRGSKIWVENVDSPDLSKPLKGYDAVIIDEFHRSGAATYRKLNLKAWGGVYFKFGLTATPYRSDDNERLLLESVLSKVVYQVRYTDAVANKRIVPLEAYYFDLPITNMKGNPNSWPAVYSELVVNNSYRNSLIASLIATIGAPTLTLVKEIRHGEILSDLTGRPFANGQDGRTRERILEFNLGENKSLIGTTGVIGEGVDTKPAEWVILAGGGQAKTQFMQMCGRGFRVFPGKESCKVILFRDASHPWLLKHYRTCVKHLKDEYGIKPVKLEPLI